ncbi:MAG: FAD-dependent oxidoreductase [Oscillospiraceae bacterium]|jgi:2,4-dienoyl-CoA reductase-like NADH-dependent reductase (Old Yellow Enzyme family)/threonine dehydrogenase-like Zn-dependent dehydrogenase|nr:FAD-dependent oxidoreductase [Oscillospiraceae bacterium]
MYECKYPHLFSPIRLGNTLFRNRIFGAPTGYQELTSEEFPTAEAVAYYARKARGGCASVAVGECIVDSKHGKGGQNHIPLDDPESAGALTALAEGISRYGAVAVAELQHAGMYAEQSQKLGYTVYGPVTAESVRGDIAHAGGAGTRVLAMTEEVIEETIEAYASAALFARRCGFGMALIHGGHGWLMSQFLSPHVNTRGDRWGGSFENRMRFPLAVADRIREKCGRGFPIEFRMSVTEANPNGYGLDEGVKIAMALDGHVDLIHASAGHHEVRDAFVVTHPSMFLPDGCNAYLAAEIKKRVKTPVATVGAFTEPELMEETVASGRADIVELARELIADPDMPAKARAGRGDDVVRCMRCFTCFSNLLSNRQFCCAVNPEIGVELQAERAAPSSVRKTILVAGGGVAGMQAALTASGRGHDVILCEKSERLGGALRCERDVPFKEKLSKYLDLQEYKVTSAGIDLRLGVEATPELVRDISPDVVIAALGARPIKPDIEGVDGSHVYGAEDVYLNTSLAGERVVILGGGLVGTELAIFLAGLGRSVTIIELMPELSDGGNQLHGLALGVKLRELGIKLALGARALKIDGGVTAREPDGAHAVFAADTVIYAVGQRPLWDEADALRFLAPEFYQIGDCLAPKNIREATRAAYSIAGMI